LYPGGAASFKVYTDAPFSEAAAVTYKINRHEGGLASISNFSIMPVLPLLFD
jgi:hypothetical protein